MWEQPFWLRIAVIASAVWFGGVVIFSALIRNFVWFDYYVGASHIGPATVAAFVGIAVIFTVCLGIPWAVAALRQKP